jgi:hypothetical protein
MNRFDATRCNAPLKFSRQILTAAILLLAGSQAAFARNGGHSDDHGAMHSDHRKDRGAEALSLNRARTFNERKDEGKDRRIHAEKYKDKSKDRPISSEKYQDKGNDRHAQKPGDRKDREKKQYAQEGKRKDKDYTDKDKDRDKDKEYTNKDKDKDDTDKTEDEHENPGGSTATNSPPAPGTGGTNTIHPIPSPAPVASGSGAPGDAAPPAGETIIRDHRDPSSAPGNVTAAGETIIRDHRDPSGAPSDAAPPVNTIHPIPSPTPVASGSGAPGDAAPPVNTIHPIPSPTPVASGSGAPGDAAPPAGETIVRDHRDPSRAPGDVTAAGETIIRDHRDPSGAPGDAAPPANPIQPIPSPVPVASGSGAPGAIPPPENTIVRDHRQASAGTVGPQSGVKPDGYTGFEDSTAGGHFLKGLGDFFDGLAHGFSAGPAPEDPTSSVTQY